MGAHSTVRRTLGSVGGSIRRLLTLAPCPVEGCPAGGCTLPIPASTSDCSLRCSRNADLPLGGLPFSDRNQPLHQSARKPGSHLPLFRPFHVRNRPRPPSRASTQIPLHGYDSESRPFPPVAPKGGTRESSQMRHGVPPHCSPHSMAIRPVVTARRGLTRARRRER